MYEALSLGALYFICRNLNEAGVPKKALQIFMLIAALWFAFAFTAGFDFMHAEFDIFPLHFNEIIRALNITSAIIILYCFGMTFLVDLVTAGLVQVVTAGIEELGVHQVVGTVYCRNFI